MKTLIIAAVLGTAALQPVVAQAAEEDGFSVSIPLRGLDLTTPAGAAAFRARAVKVIRVACIDSGHLTDTPAAAQCRADMLRKVDVRIAQAAEQSNRTLATR